LTHSTQKSHALRGYTFIAAAGLCWAVSATLGRAVFTGRIASGAVHPIGPLIIAQSRTTISFLILAPLVLLRRGKTGLRMTRRDISLCLALGVFGFAASNFFYYLAIQRTNVATAIILQYTAPVWVLLYLVARGLQRPTLRRVASVVLALLGIALVIGLFGAGGFKMDTAGVIAAQIAAFSFAYYNVAGAALLRRYDRWRVLVFALLGAAVFWLFVNPPWAIVAAHYTHGQWLFMLVFAVTSVLLPFSFYFGGLQYLDATRAIVTSCLEPVFSILIAALVLGEVMRPLQVFGIVVVLSATIVVQLPQRKKAQPALLVEPIE
jgi:drug/metabolite transporter (DMT)-like permease